MKTNKAREIGELLREIAYHDFERIEGAVHIKDYDHVVIGDELSIANDAEDQTERHIQLHHGITLGDIDPSEVNDEWCLNCTREFLPKHLGKELSDLLLDAGGRQGSSQDFVPRPMR